jgi:replicative DNA helicase
MGKSLMCMQTLLANALQGNGVHLFTLEDSSQAFSRRAMSRVAKVSVPDIMAMKFGEQQIATWRRSTPAFMQLKTLVDDTGGLTAREISSRILRHREANKTGMVIIDYIQRVGRDYKGQPEHEKIGDALDVWHAVAVRYGMSIVVCSQLNRDLEKRNDKRPQLSDMAESGRIEQYAKFIVAVHRGCVYGPPQDGIDYIGPGRKPSDDEWSKTMVFHVLKNSNGPCRAYETTANLEHMEIT